MVPGRDKPDELRIVFYKRANIKKCGGMFILKGLLPAKWLFKIPPIDAPPVVPVRCRHIPEEEPLILIRISR